MNRSDTIDRLPLELAYRANDGLEVWLLWTRCDNRLFVVAYDRCRSMSFELDVEPARAMDVFQHPYAYAAFRGVEYVTPRRRDETLVPA
jgi:hypothetical protein